MLRSPLILAAIAVATAAVVLATPRPAAANPKKLPYSYGTQTMPPRGLELEQIFDIVPVRVARELDDGTLEGVWAPRYILQTELEYGVTDRLELGFYMVWRQGATAGTPFLRFHGLKQRVRYRVSDPGAWPVDVGVYLEIAELHDEVEFEQKLLLTRRFGALELVANLWVEQEYYFIEHDWKFLYNPTLGASYQLSPHATIGLEYWARGRFDDAAGDDAGATGDIDAPDAARHFLGPTVMLAHGDVWMCAGLYLRLDKLGEAAVVDDPFGKLWVRLIVGFGL